MLASAEAVQEKKDKRNFADSDDEVKEEMKLITLSRAAVLAAPVLLHSHWELFLHFRIE